MSNDRVYMRLYMKRRYRARRRLALRLLGGVCARCGVRRGLEIDHIDPRRKHLSTARMTMVSEKRFRAELAKCQLLCGKCHDHKSILDAGKLPAKGQHGTLSTYRYCRCDRCRAAMSLYNKQYQKRQHRDVAQE